MVWLFEFKLSKEQREQKEKNVLEIEHEHDLPKHLLCTTYAATNNLSKTN